MGFFTLMFLVRVATTTSSIPVYLPLNESKIEMLDATLLALSSYYGISYSNIHRVISCESGWDIHAMNLKDPEGGSRGLLQFQPTTYEGFAQELGIEYPDIYNPFQQMEVAAYMWSIGQQKRWSCFKKLGLST